MRKNKGFTLVELLVVIAIISVIAAMIGIMAGRMNEKAQITQTRGTIMALTTACEQYQTIFFAHPAIDDATTVANLRTHPSVAPNYPGGNKNALNTVNEANQREWNKRLTFMLTQMVFSAEGGEKFVDPPVQVALPSDTTQDAPMTIDAFGEALLVNPSRNHSGDTPSGPNNFKTGDRTFFVPDIYSKGPNFIDETNGTDTTTALDTTAADDIANWFAQSSE